MIRKLLSRLRGFRPGNNTRLSWRTLLHRPGGELAIGSDGLIFCRFCFDRPEARIIIGNRCFIGRSHIIAATHVEIENDVITVSYTHLDVYKRQVPHCPIRRNYAAQGSLWIVVCLFIGDPGAAVIVNPGAGLSKK